MQVDVIKYQASGKEIRLSNGRVLHTHKFACLGEKDDVIVSNSRDVRVRCRNGYAQVLPMYQARDHIYVGNKKLKFIIKEIETEEELAGYHNLEEYHYRGTILHGRRVPLIIKSQDPLLPLVLGYIELSTTFLMSRPRSVLFSGTFVERTGNIRWSTWTKDAARKYTNLTVRIARTVISPEFRGLGLARLLVEHAAAFAKNHWNVGGYKPLFLEITADMLRYVPFVESAGMHYIGDTEGNLSRVQKDMNYILKNFSRVKRREILKEESAGIVDLQVSYAQRLKDIEKNQGIPRERLLRLLIRSPHRLSDDNWTLLHRILRIPKPTFIMGLTANAERFVKKRVATLKLPRRYPVQRLKKRRVRGKSLITVKDCSLALSAPLKKSKSTRKIQQAFGVSKDMLTSRTFSNLSFTIKPSDVVLICGPSGAGKTTLLSLLADRLIHADKTYKGVTGEIDVARHLAISKLGALRNSNPLINALGNVSFETALHALNVSGLAEAHLYVRRFKELSNGQRYRAMVAKLIASQSDVWIADEYCATLDPITANIVSRNLRRCAKQLGVTVIVAAANWSEFVDELKPDKIVHLRAPWDYRVFEWDDFRRAASHSQRIRALDKSVKLALNRAV